MAAIALNIILFIFGLALLIISADWLINSSVKLSFLYRLTPLFIGAVVVAFGTSAPEAGVGIMAAVRNEKAIALGNVVGSNIANIGLVLGICSLLKPLSVNNKDIFRRELPVLILSGLLLYGLSWDLVISRIDGLILLIVFSIFCVFSYIQAKKKEVDQELEGFKFKNVIQKTNSTGKVIAIILLSIIGVVVGADCMVRGGSSLAVILGVSPWIIAITVFAIGTSLPELAASFAAVFKKVPTISVGNVIGSNIINILLILGISGIIYPLSTKKNTVWKEIPFSLLAAVLLLVLCNDFMLDKTSGYISRSDGIFASSQ